MKRAAASFAGIATAIAVSVTVGLSAASCEQTATNLPVHSLELPQKLEAVCIQVNDANGNAIPNPVPLPEAQCTLPAVTNTNPTALSNHLYAVVTQTRRGALGIIDLTAGVVVDVDKSNPGFDAIPVGANPTDVAVTPDGKFTYVSSAATNRPGLYGIDNRYLLGDSTGSIGPAVPVRLPNVPSCGLPQAPQALAVVPAPAADGGSSSGYLLVAALDATSSAPAAVITVDPASLKPGSLDLCNVIGISYLSSTLPPIPGPGPAWPDGVPYADTSSLQDTPPLGGTCPAPADGGEPAPSMPGLDGGDDAALADAGGDEGSIADGGLEDATLGDAASVAEAGADAAPPPLPPNPGQPTAMLLRSDMPVVYIADGANPLIHVVDVSDPTAPHELAPLLATALPDYGAADQTARRVSVGPIALSPPVRVLSPPSASSPPLRANQPAYLADYQVDFKTYLYAVDRQQGTLMVYDVTDPVLSPHVPLVRPHSELSPLLPPDRVVFAAPVVAVSFVQHDWPVPSTTRDVQYTGLLCNPNPHAFPNPSAPPPADLGAYYRGDQTSFIQAMDTQGGTIETLPTRLRGVFAFATLSNGTSAVIDVDDWDAPCRRPDPMDGTYNPRPGLMDGAHRRGVLDVPQPASTDPSSPSYYDPYATPVAYDVTHQTSGVTLEPFFPVSAPHRPRVSTLLRNDPTSGQHSPFLLTPPQLFNASGAAVASTGAAGSVTSIMLPTPLRPNWIDPSYLANPLDPSTTGQTPPPPLGMSASGPAGPNGGPPAAFTGLFPGPSVTPSVRLSFDDPTVEVDQDWTVTYEGALPTVPFGVNGISADLDPNDTQYESLKLNAQGARFCARGIEDRNVGAQRLEDFTQALGGVGLPAPPVFDTGLTPHPTPNEWTGDYVEIADDLLVSTDPYWGLPSDPPGASPDNDCWDDGLQSSTVVQGTTSIDPTIAANRYNFCLNTFGSAATADTELLRDLPIWQANDDWLEVTRFAWYDKDPSGAGVLEQTTNRVINPPDPSNAPWLRAVRCCFHHQATFKVRTGGEWVASGSVVGLLHRVVADPKNNNCVLSCDPHQALLNARSFELPWGTLANAGDSACTAASPSFFDRDSVLAMRNPMFSFVMWSGCGPRPGYGDHTLTARDLSWKFSLRGSGTPLSVSLITTGGGNAVSPQSMRFLPSFGQIGIVDGASQGLELIDLNLVSVVKEYF